MCSGKFKIIEVENNTDKPIGTVILPDNSIVLGIQFGTSVYEIIDGKKVALPQIALCGQLTQKKEYVRSPGSKTILIKFQPWTAGWFLNDLHNLTDKNVSCADFLKNADDLSFDINQKINIEALFAKFFNQKVIDKSILQSFAIINETNGQIKVDDLASKIGSSKRNFERKFKDATGLTPKEFMQNTRFDHSVRQLKSSDDLSDITYDCGYYDQSHFIHHFKEVAGVSPENYSQIIQPVENWAQAKKSLR
ncbi:MAG: helix-turn-helix domain-containing protein [Bacteroidia bacterium]